MVRSRDQNAGQNKIMHCGNEDFEKVKLFKCLGRNLMTKNFIYSSQGSTRVVELWRRC